MRRCLIAGVLLALSVSGATAQSGAGAQEQFNRTADAILALKSTRFSLKREGKPAVLDEKNGLTFTTADCAYAAPDRVSCSVKVALKSGTILQMTRVWVPDGMFQSNPLTRQFTRIPADSNFNGVQLFAKSGVPQILTTAVQKPRIIGREPLQGRDTLHLKGDVIGGRLNQIIGATLDADVLYPVDLWIDDRSAIPARLHVIEPDGSGWLIELAGVNEPVDIPTPRLPTAPARPPA